MHEGIPTTVPLNSYRQTHVQRLPKSTNLSFPSLHKQQRMEGGSHSKKSLWTEEEDKILVDYIKVHGKGHWNRMAKKTGLKRCGKSCRLRWMNYLSPSVKRGNFTEDEEDLIIRLHNLLGNRWSLIAKRVPGRTDNQVKNYWNTHLSKKLGIKKGNSKVDVSKHKQSRTAKVSEPPIRSSDSSVSCGSSSGATESKVNEATPNADDQAPDTHEPVISEGYVNSFWVSEDDFQLSTPSLMEFLDGNFFDFDFDFHGL